MSGLIIDRLDLHDSTTNQILLTINAAALKINPFDLIAFQQIGYYAELYEGMIEGDLDIFPDKSINMKISDIQINRNPYIRKTNLIVSNPQLNGEGSYLFAEKPIGQLTLSLDRLKLSGKSDHTGLPFEFPTTNIEWVKSGLSIDDDTLELRVSSLGDFSANLEGKLGLNWKALSKSTLDLALKGKLDSKYESGLGFFKEILVNYKNTAGQISVKIKGNLNRPQVVRN